MKKERNNLEKDNKIIYKLAKRIILSHPNKCTTRKLTSKKKTEKNSFKELTKKKTFKKLVTTRYPNEKYVRIQRKFKTRSLGANILPVACRARLTCFWMAHKAQNPAI